MLPRFRIVAVSMERLKISRARIVSITVDVINLNPVVMLEAQLTTLTAPCCSSSSLAWPGYSSASLVSYSSTPSRHHRDCGSH
jgi:hypothetical protein